MPTYTLFSPSHFPNPLHAHNSHTPHKTQSKLCTYSACPRNFITFKIWLLCSLIFHKTHHDHATLGHSDVINTGLFHTLITSYIRAKIYRFIYSTWLSKHYQKHTHQSHIYIFIYINSAIKAIQAIKHTWWSITNHTLKEFKLPIISNIYLWLQTSNSNLHYSK